MTSRSGSTTAAFAGRAALIIAAVVALAAALVGCGETVRGTAVPLGSSGGAHPDYAKLNRECNLVDWKQIGDIVGAQVTDPGFIGAICRWTGVGSAGNVKVTLNWFESGSLTNERKTNERLGYQVSDVAVQGTKAIKEQRPGDPDSCGISIGGPDYGIIGWWVQYTPGSGHDDPCSAAQKLADASLNLSR